MTPELVHEHHGPNALSVAHAHPNGGYDHSHSDGPNDTYHGFARSNWTWHPYSGHAGIPPRP